MIEQYIFVVPLLTGAFLAAALLTAVRKKLSYYFSGYFLSTRIPRWRLKKDKGALGEYNVYKELESFPGKKRFLFNLYLPLGQGSTEIDVIMLHRSGIYVFESKNYQGAVYGTEHQSQWCHCTKNKYSFYNPISQNETHIRALRKILGEDYTYHNIIVFGNEASLHTDCENVVNLKKLKGLCHKIKRKSTGKRVNIRATFMLLRPYLYSSNKEKREHIKTIKRRTEEYEHKKQRQ